YEPTALNDYLILRISSDRNTKQMIIATTSVIAIFTMVQRKSSRCSRNGLDVSLSGSSRNLKMSLSAIGSMIGLARYSTDQWDSPRITRMNTNRSKGGIGKVRLIFARAQLGPATGFPKGFGLLRRASGKRLPSVDSRQFA